MFHIVAASGLQSDFRSLEPHIQGGHAQWNHRTNNIAGQPRFGHQAAPLESGDDESESESTNQTDLFNVALW